MIKTDTHAEKCAAKRMTIREVAALARLALTPEEEGRIGAELQSVLRFAEALSTLDLTDVPATAHIIPTENVLREDIPEEPMARELLLRNAATHTETAIHVPKTFE